MQATNDLKAWRRTVLGEMKKDIAWKNLTPKGRKIIAHMIMRYYSPDQGVWTGQGRIADEVGCSRQTVNTELKRAVTLGLFTADPSFRPRGGRSSNRYFVTSMPATADTQLDTSNSQVELDTTGLDTSELDSELYNVLDTKVLTEPLLKGSPNGEPPSEQLVGVNGAAPSEVAAPPSEPTLTRSSLTQSNGGTQATPAHPSPEPPSSSLRSSSESPTLPELEDEFRRIALWENRQARAKELGLTEEEFEAIQAVIGPAI